MVLSDKYRAGFNSDINLLVYVPLLMSALGVTWLVWNRVPVSDIFNGAFLLGMVLLVLSLFFINENQLGRLTKTFKVPFTTDLDVALGLYMIGLFFALFVNGIFGFIGQQFAITDYFVPLSAGKVGSIITNSFQIAQLQFSAFWDMFITVFTAGPIEELLFGFSLVLVGVLVAMLIWRLLFGDKNTNSATANAFYITFSIIFTGLLFGGVHTLNSTYTTPLNFLVAIVFRILMNVSLYRWGVFLSFTMGYHQMTNFIWWIRENGIPRLLEAFGTGGGIIIMIFYGLLLWATIRRLPTIRKKLGELY